MHPCKFLIPPPITTNTPSSWPCSQGWQHPGSVAPPERPRLRLWDPSWPAAAMWQRCSTFQVGVGVATVAASPALTRQPAGAAASLHMPKLTSSNPVCPVTGWAPAAAGSTPSQHSSGSPYPGSALLSSLLQQQQPQQLRFQRLGLQPNSGSSSSGCGGGVWRGISSSAAQSSQCDCPTLGGPTPDIVNVEYDEEEVDRWVWATGGDSVRVQ